MKKPKPDYELQEEIDELEDDIYEMQRELKEEPITDEQRQELIKMKINSQRRLNVLYAKLKNGNN